ncbi:hypothetical protein [Clostridium sp. MCC353]|uniref:hypothetical protein n=1 Tax=Clostridium sp. MCC353 TaxID=2592646 RepID=UPI002079C233|nr:hypothetical protein [Clostridium sp. MCC353]
MAKKGLGKFVAFAAIAGVVAAGISYFTKYKSFHDELEEDFHDFEGEEDKDSEEPADSTMSRNYVSLNPEKGSAPQAPKEEPEITEEISEKPAAEVTSIPEEPVSVPESETVKQPENETTIEDDITE